MDACSWWLPKPAGHNGFYVAITSAIKRVKTPWVLFIAALPMLPLTIGKLQPTKINRRSRFPKWLSACLRQRLRTARHGMRPSHRGTGNAASNSFSRCGCHVRRKEPLKPRDVWHDSLLVLAVTVENAAPNMP